MGQTYLPSAAILWVQESPQVPTRALVLLYEIKPEALELLSSYFEYLFDLIIHSKNEAQSLSLSSDCSVKPSPCSTVET